MARIRTLWRPVGLYEMELILESGMRAFPPRLDGQPIFYPVLNYGYAVAIAQDWNARDAASGFAGFVLEFDLPSEFVARYPEQVVGSRREVELWVPAEELAELNERIVGEIWLREFFIVEGYVGRDVSEWELMAEPCQQDG